MRLTLEVLGYSLTIALEPDEVETEDVQHGDVFSITERRPDYDYDSTYIGFVTSKGRS